MRIAFTAQPYERSHGKAPRGDGHWAFCPIDDYGDEVVGRMEFFSGTFSEARRQAKEHFRGLAIREGADDVLLAVLP